MKHTQSILLSSTRKAVSTTSDGVMLQSTLSPPLYFSLRTRFISSPTLAINMNHGKSAHPLHYHLMFMLVARAYGTIEDEYLGTYGRERKKDNQLYILTVGRDV